MTKLHAKSRAPRKKPRKSELTEEQRQGNRELARRRVVVEHVIRSLKIFRILAGASPGWRHSGGTRATLAA